MSRPGRSVDPAAPKSSFTLRALLREVAIGLVQRPSRSVLTAIGTLLGIGTLVAILGLTATTQGQISERFTVLAATEVVVQQVEGAGSELTGGEPYVAFPLDSQQRLEAVNGVEAAGVWWPVSSSGTAMEISTHPPGQVREPADTFDVAVYAVDSGAIRASRPRWDTGRGYEEFHEQRAEHVAVLGVSAARALGIDRLDGLPAVFIDGTPFTIIGIVADVQRNKEFLLSIMVPTSSAVREWGLPKEVTPTMTIETEVGAAAQVGRQAPLALRPDRPEYFRSIAPPDPHALEANVSQDLTSLFVVLALISLLIGTFGIANTTLVAVLERVPEIGLRRAVGARPRHIALQFLAESAALGTVGGLVGTALGIGTVVAVSVAQQWSPIMPTWLLAAPLLGGLTGLVAGLYPSWRATRVEPMDALRR